MRKLKKPIHDSLLECVIPHTESPNRFIVWSAISVLGSILKNKVFIKDGLYTIYPNQYVVLVSPPGIGKGTAIKFNWDLVRDTAPNFLVNMISDRVTAPRILERIATGWNSNIPKIVNGQIVIGGALEHTCTLLSTELSVLIGASEWMLDFLCESWDRNAYDYDTKNKGSACVLSDMCTSLVAATVPDYVQNIERNNKLSIKGGFTSRCLFIYEESPARYLPFPPAINTTPKSVNLLAAIKNDLEHVAHNLAGEYTYNTEAKLKFENFLNTFRNNGNDDIEPVSHFKARIRAHTLKLAMILAASRKDTLVIEGLDMDNAIAFIARVLKDLNFIFRGVGDSELNTAVSRIQTYIEKVGMASEKELLKHLHRHITPEVLTRALWLMREVNFLEVKSLGKTTLYQNRNGGGKP